MWSIDEIRAIHGVSAGAALAAVLCLKYDWETLDEFLINRPWANSFHWTKINFMRAFYDLGIYDKKPVLSFFQSLFSAKDISIDVTMREFYEITHIDLHIYCVELYKFEYLNMSHKTHPDLKLIDAIYRSCTLPLIFSPDMTSHELYIDGVFMGNYPSHIATEMCDGNKKQILGFRFNMKNEGNITNMMDFFRLFYMRIIKKLNKDCYDLPRQVTIKFDNLSFQENYEAIHSSAKRKELIRIGELAAEEILRNTGGIPT